MNQHSWLENQQFWWYIPGKMVISHGYVSFSTSVGFASQLLSFLSPSFPFLQRLPESERKHSLKWYNLGSSPLPGCNRGISESFGTRIPDQPFGWTVGRCHKLSEKPKSMSNGLDIRGNAYQSGFLGHENGKKKLEMYVYKHIYIHFS